MPEWHPWFRDWSDVLRASFLLAVPPLLAFDPPEALRLLLTFLLCLIPRLAAAPATFDLGFNLAMALQAWGNVTNVFETWLPYHDIVHLVLTGASAALVYILLLRARLLPDLTREHSIHQRLAIVTLILMMGTTINAIYEEYEWFAINVLHANLLEYYQHDINDLWFGSAGSVLAGLAMVAWASARWPTRRHADDDPLRRLLPKLERLLPDASADGPEAASPNERPPHIRLPRALVGDWTWLVRDVNDLFRLSFLAGAVAAGISGDWQLAVRFAVTFVGAAAVRWLQAPRAFDLVFNVAMAFQAWGDVLGAYQGVPGFADWVHFAVALAFAMLLYLALVRLDLLPEFEAEPRVHSRGAILIAAMCLGMAAGTYYALYIWVANRILGAAFPVDWDRLTGELGLAWVGGVVAGLLLIVWDAYGWGSRRRLPARTLQREGPRPGAAPGTGRRL